MSDTKREIEVLNFEDLDVAELERRLELSIGGDIQPDGWDDNCIDDCVHCECFSDDWCDVDCPSLCTADCITDGCGGGTYIP